MKTKSKQRSLSFDGMIREAPCLKFHNIKFNRNQTRQISPCGHKQK